MGLTAWLAAHRSGRAPVPRRRPRPRGRRLLRRGLDADADAHGVGDARSDAGRLPRADAERRPRSPPASLLASSSPVTTGAQVCTDLAAFQASLDVLTGLDLESAGVRDVIGAIQAAVTTGLAFVESAKAAFGPEAQALGSALAGLQTALQGITGEGSLGDKAATIENAVDEVAAAFDALKAEVAPGCPAPEASGS